VSRLREALDHGARQLDETAGRDLDLQPAPAGADEHGVERQRAFVDERVEPPALPERADAAGDVAGRTVNSTPAARAARVAGVSRAGIRLA
jgi:hypothetical protein